MASNETTSAAARTQEGAILLSINVTYHQNRHPQEQQQYLVYDAMSTPSSSSSLSSSGTTLTSTSTPVRNSSHPPQKLHVWFGTGSEPGAATGGAPVRLKSMSAVYFSLNNYYNDRNLINIYLVKGAVHKVRHARGGGGPKRCDSL